MSHSGPPQALTSILYNCSDFAAPQYLSVSVILFKTALHLPLSLTVLSFCFRRRQRCSQQTCSHMDVFTFHMAAVQLVGVLGSGLYIAGFYGGAEDLVMAGILLGSMTPAAELVIIALTCLDRYLAVVHPVTYLQLRRGKGVMVRHVCVAVVWTVSFGFIGFTQLHFPKPVAAEFICLLVVSLIVISFCSAAVLRVLVRPGPGDMHKVDQSKRRAFKIMVTIVMVQLLWLVGLLIFVSMQEWSQLGRQTECLLVTVLVWFNIPCSLVTPVLFLQRKRHA